jgi:tetratricopeptide (TPR) repeat protein
MERRPAGSAAGTADTTPSDPLGTAPEAPDSFEQRQQRELVRARLFDEPPPSIRIGRFVLLSRLGMGGMGVVYLAYDDQLDRAIALKLVRSSSAGSEGQARLLREAQAMARLSHPNVVNVYEVGLWEERVFVAMELVRGPTLRKWLAERPRPPAEVIEIFVQAGRGLAAAHDQGIVHRDFKPENVLIGADGRARVLDFGLARRLPDGSAPTADGESSATIGGTPGYIAPEQQRGDAVDGRADQFSFCVALYEALYGERPFAGDDPGELAAAAARGEVRPAPAARRVPAWLRPVLLRGLSPRPEARWPGMHALVAELSRDRAARRQRLALAGGAVGLVLAALVSWRLAARPEVCTGGAEKVAEVWGTPQRAALGQALGTAGPGAAVLRTVEARLDAYARDWSAMHLAACQANRRGEQSHELLDRRMACLEQRRAEVGALARTLAEPDTAAAQHAALAVNGLSSLELCADAAALLAKPRPADATTAAEVARLRTQLADVRAARLAGRYRPGLTAVAGILAEAEQLAYAPLLAEAQLERGFLHEEMREPDRAIPALEEAYWRALAGRADGEAADAAVHLLNLIGYVQARFAEAQPWERNAAALVARLGTDRKREADLRHNRALVWDEQGKRDEALAEFRRALALYEAHVGPDHLAVATALGNMAKIPYQKGDIAEAVRLLSRSLAIREKALGPTHADLAATLNNLGLLRLEEEQPEQAIALYRRALAIEEQAYGADNLHVAFTLDNLAGSLDAIGRSEEAVAARSRALAIQQAQATPSRTRLALLLSNLGASLFNLGRYAEAKQRLMDALGRREAALGPDHPDVGETLCTLGDVALAQGRLSEAEAHYRRARAIFERKLEPNHRYRAAPLAGLGRIRLERGDTKQAIPLLDEAERLLAARSPFRGDRASVRFLLARALARSNPPRARALAGQALDELRTAGLTSRAAEVEAWLGSPGRAPPRRPQP